jgi:hypothetical protein
MTRLLLAPYDHESNQRGPHLATGHGGPADRNGGSGRGQPAIATSHPHTGDAVKLADGRGTALQGGRW